MHTRKVTSLNIKDTLLTFNIYRLDKLITFVSLAKVYNHCIGPVDDREDEETDGKNYFFSNLQTSHQFLIFPRGDRPGLLRTAD